MPGFIPSKSEYSRRYYIMYRDRILQHYYDKKERKVDDNVPKNYYIDYYKKLCKKEN